MGIGRTRLHAEGLEQRFAHEMGRPARHAGYAEVDVGFAEMDRQQLRVAVREVQEVRVAEARQVVEPGALGARGPQRQPACRGDRECLQEFAAVQAPAATVTC